MKEDLKDQIIKFVAEESAGQPEKIELNMRLAEDLGMDGDDAIEFFEKFQVRFGVDLSNMKWDRHFGPEGFNPWVVLLPSFWRSLRQQCPVRVSDLVNAARSGAWQYNYENG
jgi:acyl carrier protein